MESATPASADELRSTLRPVARLQRIGAIDVLRGFALLGVVVVNAQAFAGPALPPDTADRVVAWIVACFLTAKSYSLFSLLFGLGFAIQMDRAAGRGQDFGAFFRRRCVVLFLFGVAHALLLFRGDILTLYAVLGFVLLAFREREARTLVRWAVGLLALAVAVNLLSALSPTPAEAPAVTSSGASGAQRAPGAATGGPGPVARALSSEQEAYRSASYLDDVPARFGPAVAQAITQLLLGFPNVLAMFLLGLWLGRRRAFADVEGQLPLFRSLCRWGLLLGLPLNAVSATLTTLDGVPDSANAGGLAFWLGNAVQSAGAPLLMLGYVGAIVLLLRRGGAPAAVLGRLAPLGMLSLTCYLGSSLLLGLAFYGYGLGLYGRAGATLQLAVGLAVYALLLLFATLYAPRFRYGPAEWLWRALSYGRRRVSLTATSAAG